MVRDRLEYRRLGVTLPGFGLSSHLTYLAALGPAIRSLPHDLIVEEFMPPFGFSMLPLWSRKPVISIVQWFFFRDWERRYRLPFERIMRRLPKRTGYRNFLVQSQRMGEYFAELVPHARIWTIPCGIEDAAFRDQVDDGRYALFLGRLDLHHKGLDTLIDVWEQLASAGVKIPLRIAGDGPAREWLQCRIDNAGLGAIVSLLGRVEGPAKTDLLAGCRFLAMPSRQETFGLTALEAMAASRPVLAFDIDHLNELVRAPWGQLVRLGDADAYGRAAARLWADPARCRWMGRQGHAQAQSFRWDGLAERQEQVYADVATGGSAS